ncbi:unnamed protein product [Protopolystoma xenopodis]|uniref:Uncharacterized protein n=1 Tax=Protopolystoma xenopodis TaxID=117903 RepID=A0A448X9K5_9PLAT|nr:unnamed protein product [Protopolystoma xenopodis]
MKQRANSAEKTLHGLEERYSEVTVNYKRMCTRKHFAHSEVAQVVTALNREWTRVSQLIADHQNLISKQLSLLKWSEEAGDLDTWIAERRAYLKDLLTTGQQHEIAAIAATGQLQQQLKTRPEQGAADLVRMQLHLLQRQEAFEVSLIYEFLWDLSTFSDPSDLICFKIIRALSLLWCF